MNAPACRRQPLGVEPSACQMKIVGPAVLPSVAMRVPARMRRNWQVSLGEHPSPTATSTVPAAMRWREVSPVRSPKRWRGRRPF